MHSELREPHCGVLLGEHVRFVAPGARRLSASDRTWGAGLVGCSPSSRCRIGQALVFWILRPTDTSCLRRGYAPSAVDARLPVLAEGDEGLLDFPTPPEFQSRAERAQHGSIASVNAPR